MDEPDVMLTEPPPISVLDRSRSAVWPLMASLAIGLAIGFAGGYGVGTRDRGAAASGPTGREATEVALADPQAQARPNTPPKPDATGSTDAPSPTATSTSRPSTGSPAAVAAGRSASPSSSRGASPSRPNADGRSVGLPPSRDASADRRSLGGGGQADGTNATAAPKPETATPKSERAAPIRTPERTAANRTTPNRAPQRPSRPPERTPSAVESSTATAFVGSLMVESRPTGAHVFLDGRLIGTTPLAMPTVAAGEHAVRLELGGYRRWSSSVRVVASERNRVTASLER